MMVDISAKINFGGAALRPRGLVDSVAFLDNPKLLFIIALCFQKRRFKKPIVPQNTGWETLGLH